MRKHLLGLSDSLETFSKVPMPAYKLIYFKAKGRGEVCRFVFAQAGVDYVDVRMNYEEWPQLKKTGPSPTGQLPVLEYNGEILCQTYSIARFLAHQFNLMGKNTWESAKVDMIMECCRDLVDDMVDFLYFEADEVRKKARHEKFATESFPAFIKLLEDILVKAGGNNFLVGDALTLADLCVAELFNGFLSPHFQGYEKHAPTLRKLVDKILALPKIKAWIERRPVTEE